MHVDIAMATYNGARYLRDQLDSIIAQRHEDWTLYVSDDASTDDTWVILEQYSSHHPQIQLVGNRRQGGPARNFNTALSATTADYVLLTDQDDVWPNDRVERLLSAMTSHEGTPAGPVMVFSDMRVVDEQLRTIAPSFYRYAGLDPRANANVPRLLWSCTVYGCSTIVNRALLHACLPIPEDVTMHDGWLALVAAAHGGVHYLDAPTVLYRQHSGNHTGGRRKGIAERLASLPSSARRISSNRDSYAAMLDEARALETGDRFSAYDLSGSGRFRFARQHIAPALRTDGRRLYTLVTLGTFLLRPRARAEQRPSGPAHD